jgi:uncharacterized SAM-binding protein YcdF (DUF218 family)
MNMEVIKDSIEAIFSPLGIVAILMSAGIVLCFWKRRISAGRRLLISGGLLFLIFLFSPLAENLMLGLEKQYPPLLSPPQSPKIDRIIVLAGYAEENPRCPITSNVSEQTLCSLAEGIRLYRMVPGARVILSGGVARPGDKPVAAIMADFLNQMGVADSDLVVEGNSRNTYENLREVKKLVGSRPFILVALGCDLRRAVAVARKLQMQPVPAPACLWTLQHHSAEMSGAQRIADFFSGFARPSSIRFSKLQWAWHEYLGYAWYQLLGRI